MGNALAHCMLQPAVGIRVMKSDGEMLEFDNPILTNQLMKTYPGHLVVHCSTISRSQLGQRSKVSVMRPEAALVRGQTYCLLKVPTQGGRPPTVPNRSRSQSGEIGRTRKSSSNHSLRNLFGINDFQIPDHVLDEVLLRQLQQQSVIAAQQQQGPKGPWKPALDVIAESPSRSMQSNSSITMSPLARQAGYMPASQTSILAQPNVAIDTKS